MKDLSKNRTLYAAGAVLFAILFLGGAIDMVLSWDSYTKLKVILTIICLVVWASLTWSCANEYRNRLKKSMEVKKSLGSGR